MGLFKRISTIFKTDENAASDEAEDSDKVSNQITTGKQEQQVTTKQQITTHLSQKDPIEKLNLTESPYNALTCAGVQTVGEVFKLVESGELQTFSTLGQKFTLEIEDKLALVNIHDDPEVEKNTDTILDQDDALLSREGPIEKSSLTQHPPNQLHTDSRTVEEVGQQVESSEIQTISEGEANIETMPDENNISLSREDSIERLSLTRHTLNLLTHTDIRTVGELLQLVESGRLQTIPALGRKSILEIEDELARAKPLNDSGVEANSDAIPDHGDASLSREDSTQEPSLPQHSPNLLKYTDSQTAGEAAQHVESGELQTSSEGTANTNATPDQNDVPLSREDSTKKIRLTRHALNLLKQTDIRTVGELLQWVESGKPHTTPALGQKSISEIKGRLAQAKTFDDSETDANTNITPDQNDVSLSQENSAEEPSLTEHTDLRTVREGGQQVESSEIQTVSEVENVISDRDYGHLSLEDSIERLNLRNRSFDALTRAGIRTVGETAQLVKSGRLATIPALGTKSILEIENKMAQVEILDDSEVETAADSHAEEHSTISDESQSGNNMGIQPGFQSNSEEDSTAPGEDGADAKPIETKPQSDSQTDAALRKTWAEIFKITERLAQVKTLRNTLFLREDPIETMNLSEHSFHALRGVGIRTVGEVLHLIGSIRLKTIRELGAKCILEIMEILTQVKIFNDSEVRWLSSSVWNGLVVKILNDSEVEIKRRKDEIPGRIVRWQSQLVGKQVSRGLLHEDAIIAEKSIKAWLSEIKMIENNRVYEMLEVILGSSLNICEEIEFFLNKIPGQYRMTVLLSTYGLEPKNLKQTGDELGISRERVRQIRNELKSRATSISNLKARPALLRMQSAILIAGDLGLDITYEKWTQRIRSSGLAGDWTSQDFVSTDAVEAMISIYNLLADCKVCWLQMPENLQYAVQLAAEGKPNIPAKILHAVDTLPDEVKRLINGHTKNSGGVHVKWLSQESGVELEEIKDILQWRGYRALSEHWFVLDVLDNPQQILHLDVFHRCLRRMFQHCGPLNIDDICAGLRHLLSRKHVVLSRRREFPVPPPDVMAEIISIHGYKCEDELYYWEGAHDEHLNEGETIIMDCLEQIGPVLHHSELVQAFIESDMSFPLLHATLNYSPLFDRIEYGLYKLRGKKVTYQDIERAKTTGEQQPLRPEVEYDTDGKIIVSITLSAVAAGSGTIFCERVPDLSGANWECYVDGEKVGELSAVENEFRRFEKAFELLNCQPESV